MRFLLLIGTLFSSIVFAADYKSAQRLAAGDVISADVFNDILDRIDLTLKPIEISELVGQWDAEQVFCVTPLSSGYVLYPGSAPPPVVDFCRYGDEVIGSARVGDFFLKRSDTVTISDNEDGTFSWKTNIGGVYVVGNSPESLGCYISPAKVIACVPETPVYPFDQAKYMHIERTSPTQLALRTGIDRSAGAGFPGDNVVNFITLNKRGVPPEPPSTLKATIEASSVSLSWTAGDETETSYSIQSKDAADGTFTELNTSNSESFTDTLAAGITRWYRVFAVNANGTSLGSNVVKVTNPQG